MDGYGFLDARYVRDSVCGGGWEREGGKGVVELSEWNNQARIKRPLVPYAGNISPRPSLSSKWTNNTNPRQLLQLLCPKLESRERARIR